MLGDIQVKCSGAQFQRLFRVLQGGRGRSDFGARAAPAGAPSPAGLRQGHPQGRKPEVARPAEPGQRQDPVRGAPGDVARAAVGGHLDGQGKILGLALRRGYPGRPRPRPQGGGEQVVQQAAAAGQTEVERAVAALQALRVENHARQIHQQPARVGLIAVGPGLQRQLFPERAVQGGPALIGKPQIGNPQVGLFLKRRQ